MAALGLFEPDLPAYALLASAVLALSAAGWLLLATPRSLPVRVLVALMIGFVAIQGAALAHEAGHGAVSRKKTVIHGVGHLFMSLLMGSSFSSWLAKHQPHHGHANTRDDPDMSAGLFNFTEEDARAATGWARWLTRRQHVLIWPLATLMGFVFKVESYRYVLANPRRTRTDQALLAAHLALWLAVPAVFIGIGPALVNYLLITWFEGIYLAFIFLTNHVGHPEDAMAWQETFIGRQAACARNLSDSWLLRQLFLGLNSHIEHHLFGQISYTRLHRVRPLARRACAELGIPYHEVSLRTAFAEFHRHNRRMAALAGRGSEPRPRLTKSPAPAAAAR